MAQTKAAAAQDSLLDKLLKSRYPLTFYLSRQQQFLKAYSTPTATGPTPSADAHKPTVVKPKAVPTPCFNVPDTLDPFASEYEQNTEIHDSLAIENDNSHEYDETLLLKSIHNRADGHCSDKINDSCVSILKRSSAIQLDFSPTQFETNSPLQRAIQSGLNTINK